MRGKMVDVRDSSGRVSIAPAVRVDSLSETERQRLHEFGHNPDGEYLVYSGPSVSVGSLSQGHNIVNVDGLPGELLRECLVILETLADITNASEGVAGWHMNGTVADWDEFEELADIQRITARLRAVVEGQLC